MNTLPSIVGVYSAQARNGKGTFAQVLVDKFGYREVQFSGALKSAWAGLLVAAGHPELIQPSLEALKEIPLPELGGLSFRVFGEHIGGGLREKVGPDIWIRIVAEKMANIIDHGGRVVLSDLRYPNEYDLVRAGGGLLVRVHRTDDYLGPKQPSEGHCNARGFDIHLYANTIESLQEQTVDMMESLL